MRAKPEATLQTELGLIDQLILLVLLFPRFLYGAGKPTL